MRRVQHSRIINVHLEVIAHRASVCHVEQLTIRSFTRRSVMSFVARVIHGAWYDRTRAMSARSNGSVTT
jgi:hypothetical protein